MRDLLEYAWPAVLDAARQPFKSTTWHAALTVALTRAADGDLSRVSRPGRRRFDAAVRQVARWDAVHPWQKIIDAVFAACADPAGVTALRRGALERVALLLADWRDTRDRLADTEQRRSPSWVSWDWPSWPPRSPVCLRSAPRACWPKAATRPGSPPAGRWSNTLGWHPGRTTPAPPPAGPAPPARAGPGCAWRAVWGALKSNPVYAARFAYLTSREHNKLSTGPARAVLAATLLRQLHAVITTGQRWDPVIAAGGRKGQQPIAA